MKTVKVVMKSSASQIISISQIIYGASDTKFGRCLLGLNDNKVCWVSFADGVNENIGEMKKSFPKAVFVRDDNIVEQKIQQYFDGDKPQFLLTGTDFQVKVWEYLLNIPVGTTTSYEAVAKAIEHPKAVRAVASAIARNKIAYFVPCHRVINKNGALGKYGGGPQRKLHMLREEKAI